MRLKKEIKNLLPETTANVEKSTSEPQPLQTSPTTDNKLQPEVNKQNMIPITNTAKNWKNKVFLNILNSWIIFHGNSLTEESLV